MSNIVSNFNKWVKEEEWKNNSCCWTIDMERVVYCRDCVHRPRKTWNFDSEYEIVPPRNESGKEDRTCPFLKGSYPWENEIPGDSFFCGYGKRKE